MGKHKVSRNVNGLSYERLYSIFANMHTRCYDKNATNYARYGEKGIKICDEWLNNYMAFRKWALSHGYKDNLTIDRIDGNKGYSPQNCRWATVSEQNKNRLVVPYKNYWTINGVRKAAKEWCNIYGISVQTVMYRVKAMGMTPVEALSKVGRKAKPIPPEPIKPIESKESVVKQITNRRQKMSSKLTSTLSARVPHSIKAMINTALKFGHSSMRDIMIDLADKLHSGELEVMDGKIIIPEPVTEGSELNMSDFLDACEGKGVRPQDALNKAAQMIWRS